MLEPIQTTDRQDTAHQPGTWKRCIAYRTEVSLGPDRRIVLDVPADFPTGMVEVLVLVDEPTTRIEPPAALTLDSLLASRPAS